MNLRLLNTAAAFGLVTLLIFILHIGKNLILPLIIALVIWYIIIQFTNVFHKIRIKKHHLPYGIALFISIIISGVLLYLFVLALTYSISNIIREAPQYQHKIQTVLNYINHLSGGRIDVVKLIGQINISRIFSSMALIISDILSNTTLIIIYLLFLLLEYKTFNQKIIGICKNEKQVQRVNAVIDHINHDIKKYLKVKTIMNAIAGLASYFVLLFFHIQYAEFWGMLIFLLNYIPFIGPIAAVILVLIAVSIQISSLFLFILFGIILAVIQFGVGNIIEPKYMGTHLNLSPIVILISLAFWGYIWGIVGMFLCVPVMVITNIILAHFPQTKLIAVALSADGRAID